MKNENVELMLKIPVPKAILTLSVPTVLSTIVALLYNLTDTYFVGLLDDPVQLGAISLAFPVFMVIQAIGNMFGNGAPAYISRCLGAGEHDEAKRTSAVSVYVASIMTLVMTVLVFLFMNPIIHLLGTSPDTVKPTRDYLNIIVGFSVFLTLQGILPAILRSEGKVKEAVIGMAIGTGLNIILDPVFILLLHCGVAGAAWATIIGNFVAVIYYVSAFLRGRSSLSIALRDFKPSKRILIEVLKIGVPSSIAQVIMSFTNILLNNLAAGYGDYVVSAYGVAGKMVTMVVMITLGYVSGYMPFAGYNYGAKKYRRMLSALKFTIMSGTGICLVMLIPFLWLAPAYMRMFTSEKEIIQVGCLFLRGYAWVVPGMALQTALMCTFQAVGAAGRATLLNLGKQLLFCIPFLWLFNRWWGLKGLVYAQTGADLCTTALAVLLAIPMIHWLGKQQKLESPQEQNA